MKTLELKKRGFDEKAFVKRSAQESDASILVTEPTRILVDGKTEIVYDVFRGNLDDIRWAFLTTKYHTGKRTLGLLSTSRIFGFRPRNARRNLFCSTTSMASELPRQHQIMLDYGKLIGEQYAEACPEDFSRQMLLVKNAVRPEWMIPGTPFTSGIMNHNNPLKYHYDTGNFEDVKSCMIVLRKNVEGGRLVVPGLDVRFDLCDGALIYFDGQSHLHGVSPIQRITKDAYRYSGVFYSLQQMTHCLAPDEEIKAARSYRAKLERERAGL